MKIGSIAGLIGVALLVLIANVAVSILYMVIYGHFIDPGHEPKYYQDHIQIAAPYCGIIAGIPLMFLASWWVTGWWRRSLGMRGGIIVWLAYASIDLSILLMAGLTFYMGLFFIISFATKLAAAYWGARMHLKVCRS